MTFDSFNNGKNIKNIEDIKEEYNYNFWSSCLMEDSNRLLLVLPFCDLNKHIDDEIFLLEAAKVEYSIPRRVSAIFFLYQFLHPNENLYNYFRGHLGDFNVDIVDYDDILKSLSDLVQLSKVVDQIIAIKE